MQDLEIAKKRLSEKSLTLSIVKNGKVVFEDASNGISGFLQAIEKFGDELEGTSVADKVTGKAIALLCVYAKVKEIYAIILSKGAKSVLEKYVVRHEWKNLVEKILNADRTEICPFEKLAKEISNPNNAYRRLKALQKSLKHGGGKQMSGKREQFISEEDRELKRIREKKLKELMELKEKDHEMSAEPVHITDSNFNEIIGKYSLALIDCWAPWCGPCAALAPTIEELAKEYGGKMLVGKLNVDENPRTAERFQIFSIPTMLVMKSGREVDRIVGLVPQKHIEATLRKYLG